MNKRILQFICMMIAIVGVKSTYASSNIPKILDLRKIERGCDNSDINLYRLGALAFNGAPEVSSIIAYLKHTYNINDIVETGTYKGNTTALFSSLFDNVYSIEIDKKNYEECSQSLSPFKNVKLFLGSSEKVLNELLPTLKDRKLLFYLDAHWLDFWPILDELEAISKTHRDNCIIVIDDVQVPEHKDIGFDEYKGQPLSYDYIKPKLDKIFTKYSIHYIITSAKSPRAQMIVLPQQ